MQGRCPKHPEIIQHDHLGKCMTWVGGWKMRCGIKLQPLSTSELQEIQARHLKDRLEKTTLPPWVVAGIQQIAYDKGHSCGQREVDDYVLEWLTIFESLQKSGACQPVRLGSPGCTKKVSPPLGAPGFPLFTNSYGDIR